MSNEVLWFMGGAFVMHVVVWFFPRIAAWYRDSHLRREQSALSESRYQTANLKKDYDALRRKQ